MFYHDDANLVISYCIGIEVISLKASMYFSTIFPYLSKGKR